MPAESTVAIYPLDHPRMARTLAGRIEKRRIELQAQLASGNAADWPDYKERVGAIRGLQEAIDIAKEIEQDMERN
jgi:hypothetical protein